MCFYLIVFFELTMVCVNIRHTMVKNGRVIEIRRPDTIIHIAATVREAIAPKAPQRPTYIPIDIQQTK